MSSTPPLLSVLVVDDDRLISQVLRTILAQLGIVLVEEARSGQAALARMRETGFDLVISDWNMEPMTGLDLLKAMRADLDLARIPFIMITAEPTPERVVAGMKAGMDTYITKPFGKDALRAKIDEAFRRRRPA